MPNPVHCLKNGTLTKTANKALKYEQNNVILLNKHIDAYQNTYHYIMSSRKLLKQ